MNKKLSAKRVKKAGISLLWALTSLLLVACSPTPTALNSSPVDHREYRAFTLENGLDVVVISDAKTDKAAASLDVAVGNYSSPRGREGLPHFLEHMLFLGTDKYPEVNSYGEFIDQRGGSKNAYTSHRNTNYYFDIEATHLEPALDRFSRFFIAPLFTESYVERERKAVYSEYQLHRKNDPWRQRYVLRELVNPEHPYSLFMVGDLQTLREEPLFDGGLTLREELLEFYRQYYVAKQMKLVVAGRESLDQLESMVRSKFNEVPAGERQPSPEDVPLFLLKSLPLEVHFRPEAELREITAVYPLPPNESYWQSKPINFLAGLVGSEASGSLLDILRRVGWANSLSAGSALSDTTITLFAVNVELTTAGLENRAVVEALVQHWLDMIVADKELSRRYQEQAQLLAQGFQFEEQGALVDRVTRLADTMQRLPLSRVLDGPYQMSGWSEKDFSQFAASLRADNRLVMVTSKALPVDTTAAYYDAQYRVVESSVNPQLGAGGSLLAQELKLPEANRYIAEDTELLAASVARNEKTDVPVKIDAAVETWHLPTTRFKVPRGNIVIQLQSEMAQTLESTVYGDLFVRYVRDSINDQLYPALEAGLNFSLARDGRGWRIVVGGYSDKQPLVLGELLKAIDRDQLEQSRFERIRQSYLEDLDNVKREFPFRQLLAVLSTNMEGGWLVDEKAAMAKQTDLQQVLVWAAEFKQSLAARLLVSGNFTRDQSASFAAQVADQFGSRRAEGNFAIAKLAAAPQTTPYWVPGNNQAGVLYLPSSSDTISARATNLLVAEWLSNPFYTELRTEQQLGYVVAAIARNFYRLPGLAFVVQSPDYPIEAITAAVDQFIASQPDRIELLDLQELARLKASVVSRVVEQPKNLAELNGQFFESLMFGDETFTFRKKVAEAVEQVSVPQLRDAIVLMASQTQRWWITASPDLNESTRGNAKAKKEGYFSYPLSYQK